ncbi:MAG: hypothetical protein COA79_12615 [Planctomycetota bacterium]|nr:MAG: hypothetical protein COA79_12615 [Planctomycetota bacterium]
MKTINKSKLTTSMVIYTILITFIFSTMSAFSSESSKPLSKKPNKSKISETKECCKKASKNKLNLKVTGMTCGGCASNVTKALKEVKNVKEVSVSFKKGTAFIEFKKEKDSTDKVIAKIKSLGFKAEKNVFKCDKCLKPKEEKKK